MSMNWSSTLRLPKRLFPFRLDPKAGDEYIRRCADNFYKWQSYARPANNPFILQDGPPYANGNLHSGHALNKILKDIINRVKVQQGRRVIYKPGWDCHGLPIELKALGESTGQDMLPIQIRNSARKLATRTVVDQEASFRSYAVMADWENRWTTMDKDYEIRQLRAFQKMVARGLIYRKFKPVYWSPSSRTALAEAELEYNEKHLSTAAFVRFKIVEDWRSRLLMGRHELQGSIYAVIWTTTPWTLPANRAIAVHPELDYSIIQRGDDVLIVGFDRLEEFEKACIAHRAPVNVLFTVSGQQLKGLRYVNPLREDAVEQSIIYAPFVSADSGTGLVHCAPGHGFEDYEVCSSLDGIEVSAPVDDEGRFNQDAGPQLEGISVLEGGSKAVLSLIQKDVLASHSYVHKYPYDWRTKKPLIIRATAQWFADVGNIKETALKALEDVRFVPVSGRKRLEAFIKGRSEWCISRQRAWGVPIPALYDEQGNAVMTESSIDHILSVIGERGIDAWWSDPQGHEAWIPPFLRPGLYTRGTDTMDVWFDSGSSWALTEGSADVYLEGSDQHRGWFQSSLLTRVACGGSTSPEESTANTTAAGLAPFKTLVTHGFTLDKAGKKMSKSLGNIISADAVMDGSLLPEIRVSKRNPTGGREPAPGPDMLRLWAASADYTKDVTLGTPVLASVHQSLLKYRTIIGMLLGSLHPEARTRPVTALDQIALIQLNDVMKEVGDFYDNYDFQKALSAINRWVANDLSAFYVEALKDRLYTIDGGGVLEPLLFGFLRMLAPITPVLVEEAWDYTPAWVKEDASVLHPQEQLYWDPVVDASRLKHDDAQLRNAIPTILAAHAAIKVASENARRAKVLGSSLQCSVILNIPNGTMALDSLKGIEDELATMFVLSSVEVNRIVPETEWGFSETFTAYGTEGTVWVLPPKDHKCPRCYRYTAPEEDELCQRCSEVMYFSEM